MGKKLVHVQNLLSTVLINVFHEEREKSVESRGHVISKKLRGGFRRNVFGHLRKFFYVVCSGKCIQGKKSDIDVSRAEDMKISDLKFSLKLGFCLKI